MYFLASTQIIMRNWQKKLMTESVTEICLVYLVRFHNGIEPFKRFLESYRQNPGGIDHDLLVVFKGFNTIQAAEEYYDLLTTYHHTKLEVTDEGYDITAYFKATRSCSAKFRYFCFLNSYSVLLDKEWLKKLYDNLSIPGVGLVGATASWQSHNTNAWNWFLSQVGRVNLNKMKAITQSANAITPAVRRSWRENIISSSNKILLNILYVTNFTTFPNYHIRTNAFMVSSELMLALSGIDIKTKMDAHKFESGKHGLTMHVINRGKKVLVVGKDGKGYEKEEWCYSSTFWQSEQENLLVADNQTRDYENGSPERRCYLRTIAWGNAGK